jgi:putative ABC transport system permease protein
VDDAEVIGVVGDVHSAGLETDPTLMIYVPYWTRAFAENEIVVRSRAEAAAVMSDLRSAWRSLDPAIPVPNMRTMDNIVAGAVAQRCFQMRVAAAFGASALLLAALGTYGVVAYSVALRRREIGIRVALRASMGDVRRLVLLEGLRPMLTGLAAAMAVAMGGLIRALLFGVTPTDPATLLAVAVGSAGVAAIACLLPARSAARLDPARVLRKD